MIRSFGNKTAEDIFNGSNTKDARKLPNMLWNSTARKLDQINAAINLNDLRVPPGNRLEALKGDLTGYHSIRINDQYRITFKWINGDAHEVKVEDYH
jgi:proteic killer suppression protein